MPSQTFNYTGANASFVVPAGITQIIVDVMGAQGGSNTVESSASVGGRGGRVRIALPVTPGETLTMRVGQQGRAGGTSGSLRNFSPQAAAYPDGGLGGIGGHARSGAGGGGSSRVLRGTTLLAIAGGGGGASSRAAGYAGSAGSYGVAGGVGGSTSGGAGTHGDRVINTHQNGYGRRGGGASTTAGGAGGAAGSNQEGANHTVATAGGTGGNTAGGNGGRSARRNESGGLNGEALAGGGGGGGGGMRGGGGGGGSSRGWGGGTSPSGGGGGGGSTWTNQTVLTRSSGHKTGNGQIVVSWAGNPNPPTNVNPVTGATVNTDLPSLSAIISQHPDYLLGNWGQRVEWQFATNTGFSSNVRSILGTLYYGNGTYTVTRTGTVPTGIALWQGTWYLRARTVDEFGNVSAWTSTNTITVSHPPSTTNHSPTGNTPLLFDDTEGVEFSWVFTDSSPVDTQTAYQIELSKNSDNLVIGDTGKVTSTAQSTSMGIDEQYKDQILRWRIRVWDRDNVAGAWSAFHLFRVSDAPVVTIATPTNNEVLDYPSPVVSWSYQSAGDQIAFNVVVTDVTDSGNPEVILDTEWITSTSQNYMVDNLLDPGKTYKIAVRLWDSNNLIGDFAEVTVTTQWNMPPAPDFEVIP